MLQRCPKATFNILMDNYKEGKADIMGHENQTIQNIKLDSMVSLSWASTYAAGSLSNKQSQTLPRLNSKGWDHRQ
jgi:hypothetical protein